MSDVKEVKRYIPDNTPIYLVGESTPEPTTCVVFGRDHDRIVAELKNEMAAIRAQGYNDWRMDLKRANETIAELRAKLDVEQFAHEYDVNQLNERVESLTKKLSNSLAEVVELKEGNYAFSEQIAKQRYNIDELRAEVVKARSSFTNSEAEIFNLKKQIATQARVIEIAKRVLHNAGLRPPDGGTPTVETICEDLSDAMTEIAAIEKEGEKDE